MIGLGVTLDSRVVEYIFLRYFFVLWKWGAIPQLKFLPNHSVFYNLQTDCKVNFGRAVNGDIIGENYFE